MRSSDIYQIALICAGIISAAFFGVFVYRELYPEYKIYQNDYVALEKFRSTYTGEPPPAFSEGIKQIVIEREDRGPPTIDRCTSCHVALEFPHFSPTIVAKDAEGHVRYDEKGIPIQIPNKDYIWSKLNQKIADLTDAKVIENLRTHGSESEANLRLQQAKELESLKTAKVGDHIYDVKTVLAMHPLIGKETRPFEFHPVEEYGCVSCHNGNGRGLTTEKAHGPVFDGDYEVEFLGPKKHFTESDPENDPLFARAYNDKPGPELLFQTTPLFIGSLIQAKCVQCHLVDLDHSIGQHVADVDQSLAVAARDQQFISSAKADIDVLTKEYQQGAHLYLSQACYACHRIAGFSRGGVGPELTRIGNSYPWYIKEKIVWPQGDLPSSTMPNERLDHEELESIMAFLLAQQGESRVLSGTNYKVKVQEWEKGRKMPWEKPVTPAEIHDLKYSMTVFATEGCAGCHRLKGFESNVGFKIEKDSKPDFDKLYSEHEWFSNLFPEEIIGSQIVAAIDAHADEIDQHIVDHVRQDSILEEINQAHPGQIEAYYSNFKYASRAKNHHFAQLAAAEKDPLKKAEINSQLEQWKARIHRILMMYIQEYGLGRLVGPRPNWSGIYRSDEWLMEHFHNPSAHVARSIMPVLPFDDTKFYALTYMLDVLAVRNRNAVQEIWQNRGFSPEMAVNIHCSQCHGEFLQGNGPVSEWIYPIPKNLRNANFLRNLTKERVIQSITHGVKGTPMPPWGEAPTDKIDADGIPVLGPKEIQDIADWLFSSLPGGEVIKGSRDVPKWHYSPQDVLKELKEEGGELEKEKDQKLSSFMKNGPYYASLSPPLIAVEDPELTITDLFDIRPTPVPGPDEQGYYIKNKFYTEENIEQGRAFFELNCAVCHGTEADGSGIRAQYMQDAKPRMLTNLDWLDTRDDLRLLRSIKYGVPGTAMTPWGDLTTSLQRLQLVMFIRSLSQEPEKRNKLFSALYNAFDTAQQIIERARISEYASLAETSKQYSKIRTQREASLTPSDEAVKLYQQELGLKAKLQQHEVLDKLFVDLKTQVQREENLYKDIGTMLISKELSDESLKTFLKLINSNAGRYSIKDNALHLTATNEQEIDKLKNNLTSEIEKKIAQQQKDKVIVEGRMPSVQRNEALAHLNAEIAGFTKLKDILIKNLGQAAQSREQQNKLFAMLQEKLNKK